MTDKEAVSSKDLEPVIDPFTGETLYTPEVAKEIDDAVSASIEKETQEALKEKEITKAGWLTLTAATELAGIGRMTANKRAKQLLGQLPSSSDGISLLTFPAWKNDYNNRIYINPNIVEEWKAVEEEKRKRLDAGYVTPEEASEKTGLDRKAVLDHKIAKLRKEKSNNIWKHPYERSVLVSPSVVKQWEADANRVSSEKPPLVEAGWITIEKAASEAGISYINAYKRAKKIEPEVTYTPQGVKSAPTKSTVKGVDLVWQNPLDATVLINPELAKEWGLVEAKQRELTAAGYISPMQISEKTRLDRKAHIDPRIKRLKKSNSAGLWTNPYKRAILVSPELVSEFETVAKLPALAAQKKAEGWLSVAEVADFTGLARNAVEMRTADSENKTYFLDKGEEVSGNTVVQRIGKNGGTSFSVVYISPELAETWRIEKQQTDKLSDEGWLRFAEAERAYGIPAGNLASRLRKISPENDYPVLLENGECGSLKGVNICKTIQGTTYISKEYLEHVQRSEEKHEALLAEGWCSTQDAAKRTGTSQANILSRSKNAENGMVWKNPATNQLLLHPDFIQEMSENYAKDAIETEKILDKGWLALPDAASKLGMRAQALHIRIGKLKPDTEYKLHTAEDGVLKRIKGSELHSMAGNRVFINPDLLTHYSAIDRKEQALEQQGWLTLLAAASDAGIKPATARARVRSTDIMLSWKNPVSDITFVHPNLVADWKSEELVKGQLASEGWVTLRTAADGAGIDYKVLHARLNRMSKDGKVPIYEEETGVLEKQSPDEVFKKVDKKIYVSPAFCASILFAVQRQDELTEAGWMTAEQASVGTGLSRSTFEIRGKSAIDKVWKDPYSGAVLYHADLCKSFVPNKIGTTDMAKLPEGVTEELAAKKSHAKGRS